MSKELCLRREKNADQIWRYSLVLLSFDIPHRVEKEEAGYSIFVPEEYYPLAMKEITTYEKENQVKKPGIQSLELERPFFFFLFLTALLSFSFRPSWYKKLINYGILDADLVKRGEWWRLLTALFLHQDPPHLLGNMLFGGLLFCFLRVYTGFLRGIFLVLLSGLSGNFLSLILHGDNYRVLGFSTAVFGEVGLLATLGVSDHHKYLIMLGFILAFLGFLGTTGENVDLGAHLTGALSGALLGLFYRFWPKISSKI